MNKKYKLTTIMTAILFLIGLMGVYAIKANATGRHKPDVHNHYTTNNYYDASGNTFADMAALTGLEIDPNTAGPQFAIAGSRYEDDQGMHHEGFAAGVGHRFCFEGDRCGLGLLKFTSNTAVIGVSVPLSAFK